MHVASLTMELRLPAAHSLKEKRATLRPIIDGARRRFAVAVAEVGRQDAWQSAIVGMAAVSGSASHAREVLDSVERFVWSFPEIEVSSSSRNWMSDQDS
ncbi:MAG TPA: DUF503 domain-containing protein [Acidimicrobiales bacterium]|nr:DUF503 domain-containing protein [Acidimicrobiales bacterium]